MNFVQRISVTCDLRFVVVQRSAVLIDNGGDTLVAGHNALDGVGTFDGLHLCDSFQLRKDLRVLSAAILETFNRAKSLRAQRKDISSGYRQTVK